MSPSYWPFAQRRRHREADEPLAVLAGYSSANALQRNRKKVAGVLFFFMLLYALSFIVIGRFLIAQFMIPILLLVFLIIWALPETGRPPLRLLLRLFFAFLIAQMFWPDYLALSAAGLPWITMLRLIGIPMVMVLLISLSVSRQFRSDMKDVLTSEGRIWKLVVAYAVLASISVLLSKSIGFSLNRLAGQLTNWVAIFFVATYVFSRPGNADRFVRILWTAVVLWIAIGFWEARISQVPWANSVPSFLKIEDESVQRILAGTARSVTGQYRVAAKFSTSLNFAEFLVLGTPFLIHLVMTAPRLLVRAAALATLPLVLLTILATDSRLGVGGFLMSFMLYAFFWAVRRWRTVQESILGPAITIAYPVLFALFMAATAFVGRLRNVVWGGGQHASSTDAREAQWELAIPKILAQPWGYGLDMSGGALGFLSPAGELTIDSYFLSVILDLGVVGFVVYFSIYLAAIYSGGRRAFESPEGEMLWIGPATIALVNFVIIKSVLSQQENHTLFFALLGMVVALGWRIRQAGSAPAPLDAKPVPVRPRALAGHSGR